MALSLLSKPQSPSVDPPTSHTDTYTIDIINLNNLLTRLEQNIFASSAEYKLLKQSHLHCARFGANIEYAQTLLKTIERSLPAVKSPATRHERSTDLAKKKARWVNVKERFESVVEEIERRFRLDGLGGEGAHDDDDVDDNSDDNDDDDDGTWEGIAPVSERESINDKNIMANVEGEAEVESESTLGRSSTIVTAQSQETTTAELRQRHHHRPDRTESLSSSTAILASGTHSSPTATLPYPTTTTSTTPIATTTTTTSPPTATATEKETILSTHRAEQETLTASLLTLASQLKTSSEAFQASLEHEKGILNRAVEGLDRNITGMEAAGKKMGVLRRMTEGRGWWGRMMMYAWIFGLWIVAIALVYLGPKLRF